MNVIEEDFYDCPEIFKRLVSDGNTLLYDYTQFTKLFVVLKLYNTNGHNGWSDKSFPNLLILLKDMLYENNMLSS